MNISDVNRGVNRNRRRLRVGRGPGSGRGKTSGRGHKGQGQLAGWSAAGIFEGARMPIIRQIPKRGFHNRHGRIVKSVNVAALAAVFPAGSDVTPSALRDKGVAKGIWDEIKILGDGQIDRALKVSAHHFSATAREKIVAAGGSVTELPGPAPVVKGSAARKGKATASRDRGGRERGSRKPGSAS